MNSDFSLVEWVGKVIDNWWIWLVPTVLIFILKSYIKNLWIYLQIRWSVAPYTGTGNKVRFTENGSVWKVWKVTLNNIYLERESKEDTELNVMRMPLANYWNSTLIYKKV